MARLLLSFGAVGVLANLNELLNLDDCGDETCDLSLRQLRGNLTDTCLGHLTSKIRRRHSITYRGVRLGFLRKWGSCASYGCSTHYKPHQGCQCNSCPTF